ncbi:hypothetical protein HKBW3S47_00523, partial [Candidatus Hakubella thermalkaliphila]
ARFPRSRWSWRRSFP